MKKLIYVGPSTDGVVVVDRTAGIEVDFTPSKVCEVSADAAGRRPSGDDPGEGLLAQFEDGKPLFEEPAAAKPAKDKE